MWPKRNAMRLASETYSREGCVGGGWLFEILRANHFRDSDPRWGRWLNFHIHESISTCRDSIGAAAIVIADAARPDVVIRNPVRRTFSETGGPAAAHFRVRWDVLSQRVGRFLQRANKLAEIGTLIGG